MTRDDPDFDAYIAANFPPTTPDGHRYHEQHHRSVRVLAAVCANLGWDAFTIDLHAWGRPDLLVQPPGQPLWLIEYKSYRPAGQVLRTAILQTFGYAAALGADRIGRCYLILGGTGPVHPIPQPSPLDVVQVTTPAAFLADAVDVFADHLGVTGDDTAFASHEGAR